MIDILLATFNSEKFLREQLDSIIAQSYSNWRLLIRDGGSTDKTQTIIEQYKCRFPEKIEQIISLEPASALQNFSELLKHSQSSLIMLADHDDYWLPGKIAQTLKKYQEAEATFSAEMPLLIFSDKKVVNANLELIENSCFNFQRLNPRKLALHQLLTQNVASGCTMLFNRALLNIALPLPQETIMHDYWLSLVAAARGKIIYLDQATMLYRQHSTNVLGAKKHSVRSLIKTIRENTKLFRDGCHKECIQAKALLERHSKYLSKEELELLKDFSVLPQYGFFKKRKILLKHKLLKHGIIRNIGYFLVI